MTEQQGWQAPESGSGQAAGGPGSSSSDPFGAQPAPGAPPGAPGAAGWTPPPRPGLIPLRPLDLGTLLGAAFRTLRRNPRPTFGFALMVQGVVTLVTLVVVGAVTFGALDRLESATSEDAGTILAGAVGATLVASVVTVFLSLIANAWLQGIIVIEVSRAALGEKLRLVEVWRLARGRLAALIGWSLLVAGVLMVVLAILVGLIWLMVATMGDVGIALGVLLGLLGGLGLLVLGVWIGTKISLVPSVLMIERVTVRQAVARSWALTNQAFWRTFGIQLLVAVIISVAMQVVLTPLSILAPLLLVLLDPNNTGSATAWIASGAAYVLQFVVTVVFSAIGAIVQTATIALLYIDLRMRKEGLDLELARFIESRQAGSTNLPDPYRRPDAGTVPASSIDSPWA